MDKKFNLIIIGGGPGGYVAAIRAAQLGQKVLLVEKHKIGGTCMNYGCIPAKYLLEQTKQYKNFKQNRNLEGPVSEVKLNWKKIQQERRMVVERLVKGLVFLVRKNGVEVIEGQGCVSGAGRVTVKCEGEEDEVFRAERIILATGSRPAELPFLQPNGKEILTSREALELEHVPGKMIVIGAGAIGLEMGTIFHRMGTEVTVLEILPTILPGSDSETVKRLERILRSQGLDIQTQMKIESCQMKSGKAVLKGKSLETQSSFELEADKLLLAVGRIPNSEGLIEDKKELVKDEKCFVGVNARLETNLHGVYAIGDLIGGKLLAHKASHEGWTAAENASGIEKEMSYTALPMAVYTDPEMSSVGLTEEEAREKGIKVQVGTFPLQASGRALTLGRQDGMIKVIGNGKDKVIGAHILAPGASEFISEVILAMNKGLRIQDLSSSIHIHPTLSESVMEAALRVKNEAVHVLNG